MTGMKHRRFMLLATALVALNVFFWLAQSGFALPKAFVNDLFGSKLIRAEVLVQNGSSAIDYRIDRGMVVSATTTQITLKEANGDVVPIPVASNTRIQGGGRLKSVVQLGNRHSLVTVVRQANAAATQIQVEP
jgi:hypothetical protein